MIALADLAATEALAQKLAPFLRRGDVLALYGDLGAGKTSFARALLAALGVMGDVPSPTFTLVQSYDTAAFAVYHFDLYRLKHADEVHELGWEDALADGVCLVEWPEHAATLLPTAHLVLRFSMVGAARACQLEPKGAWIERLNGFAL